MADRIKLLPDVVANQIAAGEVVNRPSSVVKEMMENAVDAGASCITVNFRDGGRDLIQVVDDGCGMSPVDARLAFDRHATSKITSVNDIYALHTFGFRGEALASIAAVSQVELRTRQAGDEVGTQTVLHGGEFVSQSPIMCPTGSQFFVRNLFYNVPARRRFLDKSTASASQIKSEFQRVALCNPQLRFELYANDAPLYCLQPASLAGRIVDVVGRHIKHNLLEVEADTSIVRVEGYVGRPAGAKRNNSEQYFFVNGRYFRSPYFQKAVLKPYEKLIPENSQPSYFLYLSIDPDRIDVNVHPQKTEVKFADGEAVWQIIQAAVRETLAKTGAVPLMDFDQDRTVDIPVLTKGAVYGEPRAMSNSDYNPFREEYVDPSAPDPNVDFAGFDVPYRDARPAAGDAPWRDMVRDSELEFIPSAATGPQQQTLDVAAKPAFGAVMPVGSGYAVALLNGRLVVVDLRRAHERVLFDTYMLVLGNGSAVCQQLLFPERLVLSGDEYDLLEEHSTDFAALGFDIDYLGEGTVEVKGTPADMPSEGIDELLYELLQAFAMPVTAVELRRERIAGIMARTGAKGLRRTFLADEAEALLGQLAQSGNVSFTPSGKKILAEIAAEEIRTKLG